MKDWFRFIVHTRHTTRLKFSFVQLEASLDFVQSHRLVCWLNISPNLQPNVSRIKYVSQTSVHGQTPNVNRSMSLSLPKRRLFEGLGRPNIGCQMCCRPFALSNNPISRRSICRPNIVGQIFSYPLTGRPRIRI